MLIAGAGGFAKELLMVILQINPKEKLAFYDDENPTIPSLIFKKYPVIRNLEDAKAYFIKNDKRFALGIGNPVHRHLMSNKFQKEGGHLVSVISPFATIGTFENSIGAGTNIFTHVVIESCNTIGTGCLIHNAAFISHDAIIGDYCEISPSVNLLGKVQTGHHCRIGTASVVLPGIKLGNNVTIGAGAVVTKNIPDNCLAVGVPARVVKKTEPLSF